MALEFRKFARLPIPAMPRNLRRWGGRMLWPRLLVALNFFSSMYRNSSVVSNCGVGSVSGSYASGVTSSLKKISLLKVVSALIGIGLSSILRWLSIYQNYFGLYLRIFGNSWDSTVLLWWHVCLNFLYARFVLTSLFPYVLFCILYARFASLQASLNHGARCLAQRFGFLDCLITVALTTPASMASSTKNYSTIYVRNSLFSLCACVISSNLFANYCVDVCSFHFFTLFMYSTVSSPPIH
jgi:hypothetical protein